MAIAGRRRCWDESPHTATEDEDIHASGGQNDLDAYLYHVEGAPKWGWKAVALDREKWQSLEEDFVSQAWYR